MSYANKSFLKTMFEVARIMSEQVKIIEKRMQNSFNCIKEKQNEYLKNSHKQLSSIQQDHLEYFSRLGFEKSLEELSKKRYKIGEKFRKVVISDIKGKEKLLLIKQLQEKKKHCQEEMKELQRRHELAQKEVELRYEILQQQNELHKITFIEFFKVVKADIKCMSELKRKLIIAIKKLLQETSKLSKELNKSDNNFMVSLFKEGFKTVNAILKTYGIFKDKVESKKNKNKKLSFENTLSIKHKDNENKKTIQT